MESISQGGKPSRVTSRSSAHVERQRITLRQEIGGPSVNAFRRERLSLRAQLARVTMERDILKKTTAYFARESL